MDPTERGFTIIEVILALALVSMAFGVFMTGILYADRLAGQMYPHLQARMYAHECLEVVRWIRDVDGFSALSDGTYGLDPSAGRWQMTGSPDTQGGFTRQAVIEAYDDDSKRLTCSVFWDDGASRSIVVETLLAP